VRDAAVPLDARLFEEPWSFEFFQAVRLLGRVYSERAAVGYHEHPSTEWVRFSGDPSLAFPPSEVVALERATDESPARLVVAFLTLAGVCGPLPAHYGALLSDPGTRRKTAALQAFLDIFNHRLVSLFYRAWERHRPGIAFERGNREDRFSFYLSCLTGMAGAAGDEPASPAAGLRAGASSLPRDALFYYAGLLAQRPRSASSLETLLRDYFEVPIRVIQFAGEWVEPHAETLTSVGATGRHNRLGVDALLWERLWDPQAGFRLRIGPLSREQYDTFLPPMEAHGRLVQITRLFAGEEFSFEIQLVLGADRVTPLVLGDRTVRLGYSAWLCTVQPTRDPDQLLLAAHAAAAV